MAMHDALYRATLCASLSVGRRHRSHEGAIDNREAKAALTGAQTKKGGGGTRPSSKGILRLLSWDEEGEAGGRRSLGALPPCLSPYKGLFERENEWERQCTSNVLNVGGNCTFFYEAMCISGNRNKRHINVVRPLPSHQKNYYYGTCAFFVNNIYLVKVNLAYAIYTPFSLAF